MTDLAELTWRRSTRSGSGNNGACVELAHDGDQLRIRDSKHRAGGCLTLRPSTAAALLRAVKDGRFGVA
jgi:hypothetical protein